MRIPSLPLLLIACAILFGQVIPRPASAQETAPVAQEIAPTNCVGCHVDEGTSGHGGASATAGEDACVVCHEVSTAASLAGSGWTRPDGAAGHAALRDVACGDCHEHTPMAHEHEPVVEGDCLGCHDPHGQGAAGPYLDARREGRVCAACHETTQTLHVHTIVKREVCGGCHLSHGSANEHLLREPTVSGSCSQCHDTQAVERKFTHEPTDRGECENCHLPHGSDHEGLLRDEGLALCEAMCHKTDIRDAKQVHGAIEVGGCAGCHDPHGSDIASLLRSDPLGQACLGCHQESLVGGDYVHGPVADGQCTVCHDPHSSNYRDNLRAPVTVLCTMCHTDKWRPDVGWPHPVVETDGCTACHDPHTSDRRYYLRDSRTALCGSCHPEHDNGRHVEVTMEGEGHPVASLVDPDGGRSEACSVCHDPHGTDNPRMWYRAFSRRVLCLECHRDTIAPGTSPGETAAERKAEEARQKYLERRSREAEQSGDDD